MTEHNSRLKKFEEHVEEYLDVNLQCVLEEVEKLVLSGDEDKLIDKVVEANSILSFICGEDDETYSLTRLRIFKNSKNEISIIQGYEVDVDVRSWQEIQMQEKKADDKNDQYDYNDDETDMNDRYGDDEDDFDDFEDLE